MKKVVSGYFDLEQESVANSGFFLCNSRPLRYFTFFYLYIMQGLPSGFALTAFSNYMTAEGVSPSVVGSFVAVVGLPWVFQFVWGPVIDRHQQSRMGKRKPWVIGAQFLAATASMGLLFVKDPIHHIRMVSLMFLLHSIFASLQDASVDAMAITVTPQEERGRMNGFMRMGYLAGIGLGAASLSAVIRSYGFHQAAIIQSLTLFAFMLVTFFIRERPEDTFLPKPSAEKRPQKEHRASSYRNLFKMLSAGLFSRRSLIIFGCVIAVYLSISLFVRAYNFHMIRVLNWEDTSVSFLTGSYGMLVAVAIALLGGFLADKAGPQRLLLVMTLVIGLYLLAFNAISFAWINHHVAQTGLVSLYFMDPALSICAMPVLMGICHKNVEGSQFTTYMALVNFADVAGSFISGKLLHYMDAPVIGLSGGVLCLAAAGMLFLWHKISLSPRRVAQPE